LHGNYKLAIVTNGLKDVQNNRIRKSVIGEYIKDIIISEEVGISKPDPGIFEHAFNNIEQYDKSRVLMVGDSLSSDIQGGINFGIDTCWYNPHKTQNQTQISPSYEISNLMELLSILEMWLSPKHFLIAIQGFDNKFCQDI
jgi:putative hydrolase of the HAD superfamily